MKVKKVNIDGLMIIDTGSMIINPSIFTILTFTLNYYLITSSFCFSISTKRTIRGLHYQVGDKAQGKLCQVLKGTVLDVAVDIRFNSPTFGKHYALEISENDNLQFWIPTGFAHGFSVLSEEVIFSYKCTNYYSKTNERAILYNDPELNIDWKVKHPIVSEKDLKAMFFKEIENDFV
ncbi:MAG: dTDP-4-dehydrorhamnose 3,5-epimerase [Ignavibacteriaceae bacterium]